MNTKVALILFKSDGTRRDFRIRDDCCVIGRLPTCDLQAPDSLVSRQHCQVRVDEKGCVFVKDLGSSNGTFVNDAPIAEEVEITAGDRVAVGAFVFTLQVNGEPADIEPPIFDAPSASATGVSMRAGSGGSSAQGSGSAVAHDAAQAPMTKKKDSSESSVAGIDDLIDEAISDTRDDADDKDDFDDGSSIIEFSLDDED